MDGYWKRDGNQPQGILFMSLKTSYIRIAEKMYVGKSAIAPNL